MTNREGDVIVAYRRLTFAFGLMLAMIAGPLAVLSNAPDMKAGYPILVISKNPPHHVEQAGGRLIGLETTRFGALAHGGEDFESRLRDAGVWHVVDGTWIARLCGIELS